MPPELSPGSKCGVAEDRGQFLQAREVAVFICLKFLGSVMSMSPMWRSHSIVSCALHLPSTCSTLGCRAADHRPFGSPPDSRRGSKAGELGWT